MRREAAFPVPRFASAPGLTFAPAFGGIWTWWLGLRGLLARDVPLAFGLFLFGLSATVHFHLVVMPNARHQARPRTPDETARR